METGKVQLKTLMICLIAISCVEAGRWGIVYRGLYPPLVAIAAARLLEIGLILVVVLIWGKGLSSVGLLRSRILPGFKKGLIWSAGFGTLVLLVFLALSLSGMEPLKLLRTPLPPGKTQILFYFLVGGIVAPVAEELFFRGILYGYLRRWGLLVALLISTLLFVIPHLGTRGVPVTQMVGGVLFAVAYEVERSLMTPITIHALGNLTIFTISLMI